MPNSTIILSVIFCLIILAVIIMISAKMIRRKRKNSIIPQQEPNIFEKITLQFSDKISKELEAAEKKIRSVVGADEKDTSDREHGMFM